MSANPIELQKHLKGMDYPASKDEVVERARENGASQEILDDLERMRRDRFDGPDDVSEAVRQAS